jgi:superfamily II DNA or RNA helicase
VQVQESLLPFMRAADRDESDVPAKRHQPAPGDVRPGNPITRDARVGSMYYLPRSAIEDELSSVVRDLTMCPLETFGAGAKPFRAYSEVGDRIGVPRFYGLGRWGGAGHDDTADGDPIVADFHGGLTDVQVRCVSAYEAHLDGCTTNPRGGMVVLPCGYGKTVFALHMVSRLKRRTLVLVHKNFLVQQWQERARQFLPGCTLGVIQQGTVEADADVVVGMVQSVCKRDYDASVFRGFGLVIIDEAHHMAAPLFSQAMCKIPARFTLALSATPERRDGLDNLLHWGMGDVVFRVARDAEVVDVHSLVYETPRPKLTLLRDGRPNLAAMLNGLGRDQRRNALIAQHVCEYVAAGRKIIVMSDRLEQLRLLDDLVRARAPPETTRAFYVGTSTAAERRLAQERQVLFTTYAMSREALDIPALDTLVMATPVGAIEQVIGRILRRHPGKQAPLVLDVIDPYSVFAGMRWKRRGYYVKQGYANRVTVADLGES